MRLSFIHPGIAATIEQAYPRAGGCAEGRLHCGPTKRADQHRQMVPVSDEKHHRLHQRAQELPHSHRPPGWSKIRSNVSELYVNSSRVEVNKTYFTDLTSLTGYPTCLVILNPFTPKSDQFQISPAASPAILHDTVWRTWLFIAYSDGKCFRYQSLTTSLIHLSLKGWENALFELGSERVKPSLIQCCGHALL